MLQGAVFSVRDFMWSYIFIPLFLVVGARCAISMKNVKRTKRGSEKGEGGVRPYQALFANLGSTLGTGNIVGVSLALAAGGAGSVFWMWTAALFGMCVSFWENTLGVKTRKRNDYPVPYMKRRSAAIFSFCCVFASFGMGNMVQANSAALSAKNAFSSPPPLSGAVLAILTALIILKGLKGILRFTDKFVPLMSAFYILFSLGVIIINRDCLPEVFSSIFKEAFSTRAVFGGGAAVGIARGVFSGEAGLGSAVILSSRSDAERPETQGFIGMLSIFIDTLVICTLTALACLTSSSASAAGAFYSTFGVLGGKMLDLSVIFFAFTSIVGWSYYGEVCARFLYGERGGKYYRAAFIFFVFLGCVLKMEAVWAVSDVFNAAMAIPNLVALAAAVKISPEHQHRKRHMGAHCLKAHEKDAR